MEKVWEGGQPSFPPDIHRIFRMEHHLCRRGVGVREPLQSPVVLEYRVLSPYGREGGVLQGAPVASPLPDLLPRGNGDQEGADGLGGFYRQMDRF